MTHKTAHEIWETLKQKHNGNEKGERDASIGLNRVKWYSKNEEVWNN